MRSPTYSRDLFLFGLYAIVTILITGAVAFYASWRLSTPPGAFEKALVTHVVDGDTIQLENGEIVRYIGINTPETVDPEQPVECFGPEAAERNRELVEGKVVELLRGVEDRDEYGRLLRYVFVDGVFVNAELITEGFARQYAYGPERRYQQVFVQLEQYSMGKNKGLWSACPEG